MHFFIEPFCISLKRTLPPVHPLNQMLKYHCREVIVPNTFGAPSLVNEYKFMDLLFAYGNDGANRLIRDVHPFSTWEVTDFRGNIKVQIALPSFFLQLPPTPSKTKFVTIYHILVWSKYAGKCHIFLLMKPERCIHKKKY